MKIKNIIFSLLRAYNTDFALLKKSKYFDFNWYESHTVKNFQSKDDAIKHYLDTGWKDGISPSIDFDGNAYIKANSDVHESGVNPLIHYERFGKKEGRAYYSSDGTQTFAPVSNMTKLMLLLSKIKSKVNILRSENYRLIAKSRYFDKQWYLNKSPGVKKSGVDPIWHYLNYGWKDGKEPSDVFDATAYLYINRDVKNAGMNPLLHYEKYGKRQLRTFDLSSSKKTSQFDPTLLETKETFLYNTKGNYKRLAIFASYSSDGNISDAVMYYLNGLKEVCDNIIFIADNPIKKTEIEKLKNIVCYAEFTRHGEYDFGSYKRGYFYAKERGFLKDIDNLVIANDSCFGPVHPFSDVFNEMDKRDIDFWGLSQCFSGIRFIQSFFFVFTKNVFTSNVFESYFKNIKKQPFREWVVAEYEFPFTLYLEKAGFTWDTYAPPCNITLTDTPYYALKEFNYPLVKSKSLLDTAANKSDLNLALRLIKKQNIELFNIITEQLIQQKAGIKNKRKQQAYKEVSLKENICCLNDIIKDCVSEKIRNTGKIRVGFIVNTTSMFPAQALYEEMKNDAIFDTKIVVAPDLRFGSERKEVIFSKALSELHERYNESEIISIIDNEGNYIDVAPFFDIVCMATPYNISHVLYNQSHFVFSNVLTMHIDYGFLRSVYDRYIISTHNYSLFWKVFVQTEQNKKEVEKYAITNGQNAIVTGYAKMDLFSTYKRQTTKKTIIISPHHSVEGGFNDTLALSNFATYHQLYLELPQKYPNIDFIFRPHPMLFIALVDRKQWTEKDCEEYKNKLLQNINVTISDGGDYFQDFANSDGIINDCGSYLVEYFYTGKPQLYLLKEKKDIIEKFTELGQESLEYCYIGYDAHDIVNYIEDVILNDNDIKKEVRDIFSNEKIMIHYQNASKKCIEEIKKELLS